MTPTHVETEHVPTGLHHVTGIAGDAQRNVDFYAGALGLELRCRTANFEDVLVPHLYYGDRTGSLGSTLTFFAFGETDPGRVGPPQPTAVGLSVPHGSLSFWRAWLEGRGIAFEGPVERFGERVLRFEDFDSTRLELVAMPNAGSEATVPDGRRGGPAEEPTRREEISERSRIRRIHGVTLQSVNPYATAALLETFDFERVGQEGDRVRYRGADGTVVDILDREGAFGREGPGTLHHVAFRVRDRDALTAWHGLFRERGVDVSRIKDRHFFDSLYVREPGGILFELATERPGLSVAADHDPWESIYLPDRFAHQRDLVDDRHPPIRPPDEPAGGATNEPPSTDDLGRQS